MTQSPQYPPKGRGKPEAPPPPPPKVGRVNVKLTADASKAIEYIDGLGDAVDDLETACALYSTWYDTGRPPMSGSDMAYELVSAIRLALSRIKGQ